MGHEVSSSISDRVKELGNEASVRLFEKRQACQVDDDALSSGRIDQVQRLPQQPVWRDPVERGEITEALHGDPTFPAFVIPDRRRSEPAARAFGDGSEGKPPPMPGSAQDLPDSGTQLTSPRHLRELQRYRPVSDAGIIGDRSYRWKDA